MTRNSKRKGHGGRSGGAGHVRGTELTSEASGPDGGSCAGRYAVEAVGLLRPGACIEPEGSHEATIILLHGLGDSSAYWRPFHRCLQHAGARVSALRCDEFLSRAQKDLEEAEALVLEEEDNSIELLEGKYHGMTCQAKSEYQLTCFHCGHGVNKHASTKREVTITSGRARTLYVLEGVCFKKNGCNPDKAGVLKLKRTPGTPLQTTGRSWMGPSGGLWVELETGADQKPGWVLVEGPGFGVDGPLLGDAPPLQQASPPEAPALAPAAALPVPKATPPEVFDVQRAREALRRISEACSRPDFMKCAEDPLMIGELFMDVCARPAADFGFGTSEEAVRRLFAALRQHAEDRAVVAELADIEHSLHLGPGSVLALAEAM